MKNFGTRDGHLANK